MNSPNAAGATERFVAESRINAQSADITEILAAIDQSAEALQAVIEDPTSALKADRNGNPTEHERIPLDDPSIWTSELIMEIARQCSSEGDVAHVLVETVISLSIKIEGKSYVETVASLFSRIGWKYCREGRNPGIGRRYLALRSEGKGHHEAAETARKECIERKKNRESIIPLEDPNIWTPALIAQIAMQCGVKDMKDVKAISKTELKLVVGTMACRDKLNSLCSRIDSKYIKTDKAGSNASRGLRYLIYRGEDSDDEAARQCVREEYLERKERKDEKIPLDDPSIWTPELIAEVARQCGSEEGNFEEVKESDTTRILLRFETQDFQEMASSLFARIGYNYIRTGKNIGGNASRGIHYLLLRSEGKSHADAVTWIQRELAEKKDKKDQRIPLEDPSIWTPELIAEVARQCGSEEGKMCTVRTNTPAQCHVGIGGRKCEEKAQSLFWRIYQQYIKTDGDRGNISKGYRYLVLRAEGNDHEIAVACVRQEAGERKNKKSQRNLFNDPDIWKPELITEIAKQCGSAQGKISEIAIDSSVSIKMSIGRNSHQETIKGICQYIDRYYIMDSLQLKSKDMRRGRHYLILRGEGKDHAMAISNIWQEMERRRERQDQKIPLDDPSIWTTELIADIARQCGSPSGNIASVDSLSSAEYNAMLGARIFEEKAVTLFGRIDYEYVKKRSGRGANPARGRRYLIFRSHNKSHEDAVQLVRADRESRQAMLAGRLPMKPIQEWTREEVEHVLHGEIRHLQKEGTLPQAQSPDAHVTREEVDAVLRREFYETNIVIRSVFDALEHLQNHAHTETPTPP